MWRRLVFSHLKTLSFPKSNSSPATIAPRLAPSFRPPSSIPPRHLSSAASAADVTKPKVSLEEVMPIATGHEREELEAHLEGRDILEINHPIGPFGTKENPAIVKSYYDRRIVGCPGGEGEDEHDVVWFWLEKQKPYECPVCTQYFKLEVVGPGGDPEGHDHDEEHPHAEEHHHDKEHPHDKEHH